MNSNLILNSENFCNLLAVASENKHIKNIKLKAYGNSMAPFIKNGNLLTLALKKNGLAIKLGDIVALTHQDWDKIIIHRVIGIKPGRYQTKGDNNRVVDEWFLKKSILGVITKIQFDSGKHYHPKRWQNLIIAFFSKTLILNVLMLPLVRYFKKSFTRLFQGEKW